MSSPNGSSNPVPGAPPGDGAGTAGIVPTAEDATCGMWC